MSGGIFVSYRRDDSRHAAGRLVDRLGRAYPAEQLFMDVDAIGPGLDFVNVIGEQVAACGIFLAIIGPNWLEARDEQGQRRLDNPGDFVRIELEAALARPDIRIIPVLVDGAAMPAVEELPPSLAPVVRRNAVRLAHERFAADATALTDALTKIVPATSRASKIRKGLGAIGSLAVSAGAMALTAGPNADGAPRNSIIPGLERVPFLERPGRTWWMPGLHHFWFLSVGAVTGLMIAFVPWAGASFLGFSILSIAPEAGLLLGAGLLIANRLAGGRLGIISSLWILAVALALPTAFAYSSGWVSAPGQRIIGSFGTAAAFVFAFAMMSLRFCVADRRMWVPFVAIAGSVIAYTAILILFDFAFGNASVKEIVLYESAPGIKSDRGGVSGNFPKLHATTGQIQLALSITLPFFAFVAMIFTQRTRPE